MRVLTLGPKPSRSSDGMTSVPKVLGFREAESEHQCAERSRTSGWPRVKR
jgi:hypothetical protein